MNEDLRVHFNPVNVKYEALGAYLGMTQKRFRMSIARICKLGNFSISTFNALREGREFPLNFYWRLKMAYLHEMDEKDHWEFLVECDRCIMQGVLRNYKGVLG